MYQQGLHFTAVTTDIEKMHIIGNDLHVWSS